jgi:hypothetical protein
MVRAQSLTVDPAKTFRRRRSSDRHWLPVIEAQLEISKNPARSIELLQAAAPYEPAATVARAACIRFTSSVSAPRPAGA